MKQRTSLTLVRNVGLLYPHKDADYDVLSGMGIPLNNLSSDFSPTLLTYLSSAAKVTVLKFDHLEAEMLERFRAKWDHDVSITNKAVILEYPKTVRHSHLEKALVSLKKWYRNHFITLEATEKRAGKNRKTILAKTLTPRKEL
jgi:hypothetical protein